MIDVASLVAELSPESPCGPNLEYDPEFIELARLAEGTPERQIGDKVEPAKEPEWPDVQQRAFALFARTKDLRVAVLLTRALVRIEGIAGLASGLALIGEMLTRYWDGVHPVIEPDDHDVTSRLNALAPLALGEGGGPSALLRDVWSSYVAASPAGRVSVRDILVSQNQLQPVGGVPKLGADELATLLKEAAAKGQLPVEAAQSSVQALDVVRSCLAAKADSDDIPDLKTLTEALTTVVKVLRAASGFGAGPAAGVEGGTPADAGSPIAGSEIRGREDAVRQLERICEFIQRTEPGNPAPLLIRRAQRLMSKDFLEIIKDLAPGSLGEIHKIAGIE